MARINVVLYQPNLPRFVALNSYREVVVSLMWGLRELGYECDFFVNQFAIGCRHIVLGWQSAYYWRGGLGDLPSDSILYNLEQHSVLSMATQPALVAAAAGFQIWDYSMANIEQWPSLKPRYPVYYAPIAYAPSLERIPVVPEDIDLMFIGSIGPARSRKLIDCSRAAFGVSLVSLSNIWGEARDGLIGRAKVMLNISNEDPELVIFEVVRVSYYIANRKAVLCEARPGMHVEPDLQQVLRFHDAGALPAAAAELVADPELRRRYAEDCYEVFRQRDVRAVLRGFFQ